MIASHAAALGISPGSKRRSDSASRSLYRAGFRCVDGLVREITWRLALGSRYRGVPRVSRGATRELRAALVEIERPSRSLTLPERRAAFLADKWDVYAQLALTESARGRPALAFEASERLRAREMLELLTRGRIYAPRDTAHELVAREQDLRRRIAELTRELEGTSTRRDELRGPDVSGASEATREALLRAQQAYAELRAEPANARPASRSCRRKTLLRAVAQRLPRAALIDTW